MSAKFVCMSCISCDIDSVNIFILVIFHSESGKKMATLLSYYLLTRLMFRKIYRTAKCYAGFHLLNEECS